jgi:hypothetical protein
MKVSYLDGLPFFSTYNFIPTPAGDLKVIAFKLNSNLRQKHSTFGDELEALNYCRIHIKMIYEIYKYSVVDGKDVGLLHSQNCYGTIININGIGIISPRLLNEQGIWIANNNYYIRLHDAKSKNIDLKSFIRSLVFNYKFDKKKQIELFLNEVEKHGEVL